MPMNRKKRNKRKLNWRKIPGGWRYVYGKSAKRAYTERWHRDPVNAARFRARLRAK